MKVILKEDVKGLGAAGDVKEVKKGHAENFLIPRRLALMASDKNMKVYEEYKRSQAKKMEKDREHLRVLADQIAGLTCNITAQAGEDEKLYGSVTAGDIADGLKKLGVEIDKRKIVLEEPIKKTGVYNIVIHLAPEIEAEVKVWVIKK